jgi:hypothetical protein
VLLTWIQPRNSDRRHADRITPDFQQPDNELVYLGVMRNSMIILRAARLRMTEFLSLSSLSEVVTNLHVHTFASQSILDSC